MFLSYLYRLGGRISLNRINRKERFPHLIGEILSSIKLGKSYLLLCPRKMVLLTRIPILDRCKEWFKARGFVSKISVDRCCCYCDCCCCDGTGVPFILLKSAECWQISEDYRGEEDEDWPRSLLGMQRRWSLAEGWSFTFLSDVGRWPKARAKLRFSQWRWSWLRLRRLRR